MNQAQYFRNEWWDMLDAFVRDPARKKQLEADSREVWEEMIFQEYQAGMHPISIAAEYDRHVTTIHRIIKKKQEEKQ